MAFKLLSGLVVVQGSVLCQIEISITAGSAPPQLMFSESFPYKLYHFCKILNPDKSGWRHLQCYPPQYLWEADYQALPTSHSQRIGIPEAPWVMTATWLRGT
ncbi:hypothetical protein AFLA_014190 [Aspergillus flavus NRRL3357]|nr:hypothetical protein AFLA_014190 [Aspergillus flavus NRRL3357]